MRSFFVDPPGLPDKPSFHSGYRDRLLAQSGSNRTERKENALWAFLAKGPDCRGGSSPGMIEYSKLSKSQRALQVQALSVDPPGLEPGLCGTKIRRVANYTMGHHYRFRYCKIRKFLISDETCRILSGSGFNRSGWNPI